MENFEAEIFAALEKDLRKNRFESAVTELYFIYTEIDFAIKKLKGWMRPKPVGKTMSNLLQRIKSIMNPKAFA